MLSGRCFRTSRVSVELGHFLLTFLGQADLEDEADPEEDLDSRKEHVPDAVLRARAGSSRDAEEPLGHVEDGLYPWLFKVSVYPGATSLEPNLQNVAIKAGWPLARP